jgi:hypothetical protein
MTEPVTSKLTTFFWIKCVLVTLLLLMSISVSLSNAINPAGTSEGAVLAHLASCAVLFIVVYFFSSIKSFRIINATADAIIITNLLTPKKIVINYDDIVYVSNERTYRNWIRDQYYSTYRILKIDLKTGERISFNDKYIINYDELKEAIRRFRFKLD